MKMLFEKLEKKTSVNDGTWGTFFYNNEKYNGVVYDKIGNKIYWIFEVKNGLQNGIEKTYYENTDIIEQISEYKDNFQYGISKEYLENGDLKVVSIIYNNDYLRIIEKIDGIFKEVEAYDGKYGDSLPMYLQNLLKLSNSELIDYQFKEDNSYLNLDV